MFRQQQKIVEIKCCCSFTWNPSKNFCIYCHLTYACFCITPFATFSSPCIKFDILCSGLYFCLCLLAIHITFPGLHYSAVQCNFGTVIRFLVPFHLHIFCLAFFISNHFKFLFQLIWNLCNIGCELNVIDKCIKPMLICKFSLTT